MRVLFLLFIFLCHQTVAWSKNQSIIPPVIVKAKPPHQFTTTHAPKTIITQQEISDSGAASLAQALQELGGVQLQDTTGNGSQVLLSMRGFGANASSNTLLLVNGIPITNPDMAPPDLNAIPLQEIESMEIISGSESVLYGDQAVGGTINIITRKNVNDKINASCSAGSYDQHTCSATANQHIGKLKLGVSGLTNHTNNYRVHNDYDQNLIAGQALYPYSTGYTSFGYQVANERMQYPGALTAAQVAQKRRQANNNTDFFRDWHGIYHLQNQQQLNKNWRLETDFARREMHGDGVLTQLFTQSRTTHFLKPQLKGTLWKTLVISGIEFEDDFYHLNSPFGTNADSEQKYGLFGLTNTPITSQLSFSAGARGALLDSHLKTFTTTDTINRALATTLGITFEVNPDTTLYLRRAESFRFPKADENATTPRGLKTQRGVSYETGVEWFFKKLTSKFGIYQLNLKDEIQFDPTQTAQDPFGTNRNLDPTTRDGTFLSEKFNFNEKFSISGQYNFVNARFQKGIFTGKRIPLVSENLFRIGASLKPIPHWNLYAETIYTGSQFADNDNANIAKKVAPFTVYNCSLRYHLKNLSVSFRINNIFNKKYYFYTVFQPSMRSEFFYPAPERNFLFTVKYDFA